MTCRICDHPGVVMKPFTALLMTSLVLGACEKSNDITQLHEDAVATAKYYGPRVDDMIKRKDALGRHDVRENVPDIAELRKLNTEANDKISEMHGIASADASGKSALEKQADQLAKDGKIDELRNLIDESQEKLDKDWTIANDDISKLEGWVWQYEHGWTNPASPVVAPPLPTPSDTGEAAPAAAAPEGAGSAAGSAAKAKGDEKKGEAKSPDNKAAEKAAGEKADKKAAPKADDKKAAPKAGAGSAAPKPGAGSAAK
jgi:hypothetical protein